jgi:hypothetical protein
MIYQCEFTGRKVNASGLFYRIADQVILSSHASADEIRDELYKKYEHVQWLRINGVSEEEFEEIRTLAVS